MTFALSDLIAERGWLLADGATGTNYFDMGLKSGEPPENWNVDHPDRVRGLHKAFIEAGSDIVLTNSFGGNARRMMMHGGESQVREVNARAAELARAEADDAGGSVLVAGSIGPTGELLQPLGELTHDEALECFAEQTEALAEGGADLLWCETMSAENEVAAAVEAGSRTGLPIVVTMSFDSGGRTMMGIKPGDWPGLTNNLPVPLAAYGANCGMGAAELVATMIGIASVSGPDDILVAKSNCGMPEMTDRGVEYTGTPKLMADYARLALDVGVQIIGGCCGTTPSHLATMHEAMIVHEPAQGTEIENVIELLGSVSQLAKGRDAAAEAAERRKR